MSNRLKYSIDKIINILNQTIWSKVRFDQISIIIKIYFNINTQRNSNLSTAEQGQLFYRILITFLQSWRDIEADHLLLLTLINQWGGNQSVKKKAKSFLNITKKKWKKITVMLSSKI